jgi:hypothetical protein
MTTSGIYILEWPSGKFYIGKSDNIERRWKEHANSFVKGKHAKAMQNAYLNEGPPNYRILENIHPDHIDLYEGMYITKYINEPSCLNATKGKLVPDADWEVLTTYKIILTESTADHIRHMALRHKELQAANERLQQLDARGVQLPEETKGQLSKYEREISSLKFYVKRLMDRSLWQRIFNSIP